MNPSQIVGIDFDPYLLGLDVDTMSIEINVKLSVVTFQLIELNIVIGSSDFHDAILSFTLYQLHGAYTSHVDLLERFEFKILGDDIVAGVYLFGIPAIHVNTAARKCCHTCK
jgi:hypothetical protein